MTASPQTERLVEFSAETLRARLPEALNLYVTAMRYPSGTAQQRAPMWLAHMIRAGWRCVGALDQDGRDRPPVVPAGVQIVSRRDLVGGKASGLREQRGVGSSAGEEGFSAAQSLRCGPGGERDET